jgi:hypothetical protein
VTCCTHWLRSGQIMERALLRGQARFCKRSLQPIGCSSCACPRANAAAGAGCTPLQGGAPRLAHCCSGWSKPSRTPSCPSESMPQSQVGGLINSSLPNPHPTAQPHPAPSWPLLLTRSWVQTQRLGLLEESIPSSRKGARVHHSPTHKGAPACPECPVPGFLFPAALLLPSSPALR